MRPAGSGRRLVRVMRASASRSRYWLSAEAPPHRSAVPIRKSRKFAAGEGRSPAHGVADRGGHEHERRDARLRQLDEVGDARGPTRPAERRALLPRGRLPGHGRAHRNDVAAAGARAPATRSRTRSSTRAAARPSRRAPSRRGPPCRSGPWRRRGRSGRARAPRARGPSSRTPARPERKARTTHAATHAATTRAHTRWAKWIATGNAVSGGTIRPSASGKSGIASPALVWRMTAPISELQEHGDDRGRGHVRDRIGGIGGAGC